MTPKQKAFVAEYLVDLNATQAAIRAGYSEKTASRIGPNLIGKSCIQEAIQAAMSKREKRTEITADRVIQELARIAFLRSDDIFEIVGGSVRVKDTSEMSEDARSSLSGASETITEKGGTVRVQIADKVKSLELLGKHLALFTDRVNMDVSGSLGLVILPESKLDG